MRSFAIARARSVVAILFFTAFLLTTGIAVADGGERAGANYEAAEREHQRKLLDDAAKLAQKLGGTIRGPDGAAFDIAAEVDSVRALIAGRAPIATVRAAIERPIHVLIGAFRIAEAPTSAPDLARGSALYAENCATCHGPTGRADTQRAASLTPRPANFHSAAAGALTPFRVTTTLRFGVDGTAMIPFGFLSARDRWDLAFFVLALRQEGTSSVDDAPTYAVAELANRSDSQLGCELRSAGILNDRIDATVATLRRSAYDTRRTETPSGRTRARMETAPGAGLVALIFACLLFGFVVRRIIRDDARNEGS